MAPSAAFASLLTQSGQSTRVLLREHHKSTLHPGVDFTSLEGQVQLLNIERGFVSKPGKIKRLLVMTKASQVVAALAPLVGKLDAGVPIVLLHNGMGIAEQVVEMFPHNPVIAGVTSHGAMQGGHFVFRHTGKGETWLGRSMKPPRPTPRSQMSWRWRWVRLVGMSRYWYVSGRSWPSTVPSIP